jgi:subtilisin-like proprotein convertase family protein
MKTITCACACMLLPLAANAATTISNTWTVNATIPDNDDSGYTDTRNLVTPAITEIESVTVALNFTGGWNGDLYAYLVHDTGFSVLLNRPGRDTGTPDGSATVGMSILLDDLAATDIHTGIPMSGGLVTGTWKPDGRTADPLVVVSSDPRNALLSSFNGLDANGNWTLFVADQSSGNTSTLQSWSLTVTGIPEPSAALLAAMASLALLRRRRE